MVIACLCQPRRTSVETTGRVCEGHALCQGGGGACVSDNRWMMVAMQARWVICSSKRSE